MSKEKSFPSLGARIAAALVSYQLGHAGVDRVLKQYANVKIDPWWEDVGRALQQEVVKRTENSLPDPPSRIQ